MYYDRILKAPAQSFFLLGPRGTGKTTWLRHEFPQAHVVNLLDESLYQSLLANPALFAAQLQALPETSWVVVDEIQRLPNLLNEVHRFIEERHMRFVLCGSSARKLKRAGVNLLAGRALMRHMHPFVPAELGGRFELESALQYGLLPVVWGAEDRKGTLTAYAQLYLKEEIHGEALVRNLPAFSRFLPLAAIFHGQAINTSNIASEAQASRTTVLGYLDILEETLLCFRLPAYEAKLRVRERKHPKLYWCDPGLVRIMKRADGTVMPEERGSLFEGLVAQLLRTYRDCGNSFDDMHYWAPSSGGTKVDFLLVRGSELIAIEVKCGRNWTESWGKGLRAVADLKGMRRRLLVYPEGPRLRTKDGIEVIPFHDLAQLLHDGTL